MISYTCHIKVELKINNLLERDIKKYLTTIFVSQYKLVSRTLVP